MEQRRRPISLAELARTRIEPPAQTLNNGAQSSAAPSPLATPHHTQNRSISTAGRGYNLVVFEGRLAETPVLSTARTSSRVYCRVAVIQDQPDWNGLPDSQSLDLLMFDERARMFVDRFRKGDAGTFIGRMEIRKRYDRHGQFHMDVVLHLERVVGHKPALRERDIVRWLAAHGYQAPAGLAATVERELREAPELP
jgi:hypothetical protein